MMNVEYCSLQGQSRVYSRRTSKRPCFPGLNTFKGRVLHTSQYREPSDLAGQRVLIVGTGAASGSDIAQDLAGVAASVMVSVRTERWILHRGMVRLRHCISVHLLKCRFLFYIIKNRIFMLVRFVFTRWHLSGSAHVAPSHCQLATGLAWASSLTVRRLGTVLQAPPARHDRLEGFSHRRRAGKSQNCQNSRQHFQPQASVSHFVVLKSRRCLLGRRFTYLKALHVPCLI